MARSVIYLMLGLALGASRARAWDLGVDYGIEGVSLGEYYTGVANVDTPGFELSLPITRYSLTDYSGQLAAGISNATHMMAAQEGAHQDAIADAERKAERGEGGEGHGSRSFTLEEPVEGRTVISYATGSGTGGTYKDGTGTGAVASAKALEIDYLRNVDADVWASFYDTAYAVDMTLIYKEYDVTYMPNTATTKTVSRPMMGIPLGLTLAHGLGLEGLQAQAYGDFDVLMGLTYFAKLNGLSYGYGARVNYKKFGFLSVFAGYDVRAYLKSSVTDNTNGTKRIEGPTQLGAWKAGVSLDLSTLFKMIFTEID